MNISEHSIEALAQLGESLHQTNEELQATVAKAVAENQWFTTESCWAAIDYWSGQLNRDNLTEFQQSYNLSTKPKTVGVIMAGNLPLVGMHDLVVVLLSGHRLVVKASSDDKALIDFVLKTLKKNPYLADFITNTERIPTDLDAVIATGSNNSFRYFEYYFKDIPHLLRKNRKSIAVLTGDESASELEELSDDIFTYFGLGCRNVSLIFLPREMDIIKVIDGFEKHAYIGNHNRFANNYTYHKALFLMNQQEHLDNGFVLIKQEKSLNVPLGCLFYSYYDELSEVDEFTSNEQENIQCTVGKNYPQSDVAFGATQNPSLQDFADRIDSMEFLASL